MAQRTTVVDYASSSHHGVFAFVDWLLVALLGLTALRCWLTGYCLRFLLAAEIQRERWKSWLA